MRIDDEQGKELERASVFLTRAEAEFVKTYLGSVLDGPGAVGEHTHVEGDNGRELTIWVMADAGEEQQVNEWFDANTTRSGGGSTDPRPHD